jgi:endonuclease/exonuclease/phosphatase family metal-dependent hydrolase
VLVRSWNIFHGNTAPPQRRAFLDEMIELVTRDRPDVLCLQEVPAWALGRFTAGEVAARPSVGPVPVTRGLGRLLTEPDHGRIRSAFSGQGVAVQLAVGYRVLDRGVLVLNSRRFRRAEAQGLRLHAIARLAWAKERRVVQILRCEGSDGRTYLIANLHCTSYPPDDRLADAEVLRAAWFAVSCARHEDVVVLAGDFNVAATRSASLRDLTGTDWGFSAPGPGIDHILVRGAPVSTLRPWPEADRALGDVLLSDHAPVELEIG